MATGLLLATGRLISNNNGLLMRRFEY